MNYTADSMRRPSGQLTEEEGTAVSEVLKRFPEVVRTHFLYVFWRPRTAGQEAVCRLHVPWALKRLNLVM
jgi:hypothetical protein